MNLLRVGRGCVLTALPKPADGEEPDAAQGYLRCETCAALIPVGDIGSLVPGRCPGERE